MKMKTNILPPKELAEFIKLHAKGQTMDQLSRKFGIRKASAVALSHELGINRPKGPKPGFNYKK